METDRQMPPEGEKTALLKTAASAAAAVAGSRNTMPPQRKEQNNLTDSFSMKMPRKVASVIERLEKAGFEAWLVGGCVRDALYGQTPHDFDVATSATPQQVQRLFEKNVPTGIAHGTVTVFEQGIPVEVTTFRTESGYQDHRHPDQIEFVQDIREDLARRDFTINAMAWNPHQGLVDPFGGRQDLEKGIIRAVGNPAVRFEEDALRMLRAFRFAGRFGFQIDPDTQKAIEEKTPLIASVAVERIVPEVEAVMKDSPQILESMTGLLAPWIPELETMKNTPQNSIYHYTDVLHHTLDALAALPEFDRASAWALLLHDTGKPKSRVFYGGHDHFPKHADESARIARRIVKAIRLPRKLGEQIVDLVRFHDIFYAPRLINLYKIRIAHGLSDETVEKLFRVQYSDIQAHTSHDRMKELEAFQTFYETHKLQVPLSLKALAVNGSDAQAAGLEGAAISAALQQVLKEAILHPEICSRKEQLRLLEQEAEKQKSAAAKQKGHQAEKETGKITKTP